MPLTLHNSRPLADAALPDNVIQQLVGDALAEDWGQLGDVTSAAVIPESAQATAIIRARQAGILAGLDFARAAFAHHNAGLSVTPHKADGDALAPGMDVLTIKGPARALLGAERVALNFLGHLSGIASQTAALAALIAHTGAQVCDTRKTTPGLRAAEKYAVRAGGGANHRFGLGDAILIKDNHIAVAGGVSAALRAAKAHADHNLPIEIEVDNLDQLDEAMAAGAEIVLLDNMPPDMLAEAVRRIDGRAVSEASGQVSAQTITAIAESGVDYISVGRITHSAPCLDLGLDIDIKA